MDSAKFFRWTFLHSYSSKKMLLIAGIIIIIDMLFLISKGDITAGDSVVILLEGYGCGYLNLIPFLFFVVVNGIPLYFASLALDNQSLKTGSHVLIRCRSKAGFFLNTQFAYIIFTLGYFLLHILALILFCMTFGLDLNYGSYTAMIFNELFPRSQKILIVCLSLVLRFLELLCFQSIIVFLQSITNKLSLVFVCVICGYFALIFVPFKYNPFGLSSILRWPLLNANIYISFGISVAVFCAIITSAYIYMFKHGIYQLLER